MSRTKQRAADFVTPTRRANPITGIGLIALIGAVVALLTVGTAVAAPTRPAAPRSATAPARLATSVSDGTRTLTAEPAENVDPNGQTITVSGSGYDEFKGIYVAFCVEPLPGKIATPCGGGADTEGNTGASFWISNNPPAYGVGLAQPYGPGGSFTETVKVSPMIGNIDCRRVQCVIATRNDHTRTSDRGQDVFVPVSFAPPAESEPGQPADTTTTTTRPATPADEAKPAPQGTVATDGRSVSAGAITLSSTQTTDLNPKGQALVVTGSGFNPEHGLRVAFCGINADGNVGACLSREAATAIAADSRANFDVSSNPSPAQQAASEPYGPSGSFGVSLAAAAQIDPNTNCFKQKCAVVTLPHPDRPSDHSQDLVLPVTFKDDAPASTTTAPTTTTSAPASTTTAATAEDTTKDEGGSSAPWIIAIVVLLAAAGGGAYWWRQRSGEPDSPTVEDGDES